MKLRSASTEDFQAIAKVWRNAWVWANPKVRNVEDLYRWVLKVESDFLDPYEVVLCEANGKIVGFTVYSMMPSYLYQLFVKPEFHGQGVGSLLFKYAESQMSKPWKLHVALDNLYAINFYERKGLERGSQSANPVSGRSRIEYFRRLI